MHQINEQLVLFLGLQSSILVLRFRVYLPHTRQQELLQMIVNIGNIGGLILELLNQMMHVNLVLLNADIFLKLSRAVIRK